MNAERGALNVIVTICTADEVPIVGATVALDDKSGETTDDTGALTLTPGADTFALIASMTNYLPQSVTVSVGKNGDASWDDPGTTISSSGGGISIRIRLGRLRAGPNGTL